MDENKSSETTSDTNGKQLNKVKEFLDKFISEAENNPHGNNIQALGHVIWKENMRHRPKKEPKGKDGDDEFEFYSTQFEFSEDSAASIGKTINEKLERLIKWDEEEFRINQKLTHGSYGYEKDWEYDVLNDYLHSMNASTSKNKRKLITKEKGNKKVKEGTSLAIQFIRMEAGKQVSIFFIILINLRSALSKSSKKILLNLDKLSKAQKVASEVLVIEPDSFHCIVFDKDLFVFNQIYFYYLFVPTIVLQSEIEESRSKIETGINNIDSLISYAKRNPAHVRDLYYFVSKGAQIPDIKVINEDLQIIKMAGVQRALFTINNQGKIDCNEQNAGLVLSYLAKKLGLNITDKRLMNIEASTNI